jgi:hypothetical protein
MIVVWDDKHYVVEVKAQAAHLGPNDVAALHSRIEQVGTSSAIGVLVTLSGLATGAEKLILARRDRPILLIQGDEVEALVAGGRDLADVLAEKLTRLVADGVIDSDAGRRRHRRSPSSVSHPLPEHTIVTVDAEHVIPMLTVPGGFDPVVFVDALNSIDLSYDAGVWVDLWIEVDAEQEVCEVMQALTDLRWTSSAGRWSIRQAHENWHGSGAAGFIEALTGWRDRYGTNAQHHTEEFTYFDVCDGGYFSLAGDVSARDERQVSHCQISFNLAGIPLDTTPLTQLARHFGAKQHAMFRATDEYRRVVVRRYTKDLRVRVEPTHFIVSADRDGESWAEGVVVASPFVEGEAPGGWPPGFSGLTTLVCSLRHHHLLAGPRDQYYLDGVEYVWTSDALLLRPVVDWDMDVTFDRAP